MWGNDSVLMTTDQWVMNAHPRAITRAPTHGDMVFSALRTTGTRTVTDTYSDMDTSRTGRDTTRGAMAGHKEDTNGAAAGTPHRPGPNRFQYLWSVYGIRRRIGLRGITSPGDFMARRDHVFLWGRMRSCNPTTDTGGTVRSGDFLSSGSPTRSGAMGSNHPIRSKDPMGSNGPIIAGEPMGFNGLFGPVAAQAASRPSMHAAPPICEGSLKGQLE